MTCAAQALAGHSEEHQPAAEVYDDSSVIRYVCQAQSAGR